MWHTRDTLAPADAVSLTRLSSLSMCVGRIGIQDFWLLRINSIGSKLAAEVPDPFTWRAVHLENEAARRDRAAAWEFPH